MIDYIQRQLFYGECVTQREMALINRMVVRIGQCDVKLFARKAVLLPEQIPCIPKDHHPTDIFRITAESEGENIFRADFAGSAVKFIGVNRTFCG